MIYDEVNAQKAARIAGAMTYAAQRIGTAYNELAAAGLYAAVQAYYHETPIQSHEKFWSGGAQAIRDAAPNNSNVVLPTALPSTRRKAGLIVKAGVAANATRDELIVAGLWIFVCTGYENPPTTMMEAFCGTLLQQFLEAIETGIEL